MSVIFEQLRISDDGGRMYINLHVNKAEYFNDIYLDNLTIMTYDRLSETDPHIPTEDYIYNKVFDDNQKEANLVLTADDFLRTWEEDPHAMQFKRADMSNTLFFVFVRIKGVPSECTPCRLDEEITLGVTFDENMLYQRVMDYTKDLAKDCQIPVGFTDFILLWNAFKAAIETEHYIPAIDFWKKMFGGRGGASLINNPKPCGCHG